MSHDLLVQMAYLGGCFHEKKGCFVALRPLELDVQRTFCFVFARLLPQSLCLICELIIKVHKISVFKEYTLGCPF